MRVFNSRLIIIVFLFSIPIYAAVSQDASGWTVVTPSADSRIVYVSSSTGSDTNDGISLDYPVQTISRAEELIRDSFPDWILLRRGDVWDEPIPYWSKSGRGEDEPVLISSYGTGSRPLLRVENRSGFSRAGGEELRQHIFLIGVDFYSYKSDRVFMQVK
jgi:hypothetical protein